MKSKNRARGASFVEAAIALPVLFLCVFALFDFARFVSVQAVLFRGAESGLDLATKIADINATPNEAATTKKTFFDNSRLRVINAATALPLSLISGASSTASTRLLAWRMNSPNHPLQAFYGTTDYSAILIRPGEQYIRSAITGFPAETINHPTAPFPNLTLDNNPGFDNALYDHPLILEMRARFQFLFPLFGARLITARVLGFREIYSNRKSPNPLAPTATVPYVGTTILTTTTTTILPPSTPVTTTTTTSTTVACGSPPPCSGIGVYINTSCVCSCKPGRVQVSPVPPATPPTFCVYAGE